MGDLSGGLAVARTSSRPLMRMVTEESLLMSGSTSPTLTTSNRSCLSFDKEEKDAFVASCKDSANTGSDAYKKVYWFSWNCFQAADADRDGQVSNSEFATMINVATSAQKMLGLPAPFQTSADRDALFGKMDENGDGSISFDEWLACFMKEIIAPVAAL